MIRFRFVGIAVVTALVMTGRPASAEMIDFTGVGRNLSHISISVYGRAASVTAGELNWTWLTGESVGSSFVSYCVDATTYLTDHQSVDLEDTATLRSGETGARVAYLFNTFAATVNSNLQAAALQLAIWEALYDSAQGLDVGNFKLGSVDSSLVLQTNRYLSQLYSSRYQGSSTTWLNTSNGQDQVTNKVPEPSSLLLMAGAALVLGRRRLRRR